MKHMIWTLFGGSALALMLGLWIPLKAMVAQELLALAWAESQARQVETRPWPWADTWPVARLQLPTMGVSLIVLAGSHGESLAFGPGRVDTGLGDLGPVILAGHRDTHFRHLKTLAAGDALRLQGRDQQWREYRVADTRVVDSRYETLDPTALGPDTLLLVTCYPFDAMDARGPLRFVVEAHPANRAPVNGMPQNETVAAL
ncbi:MAG: sortase, marine proteobacterial type [Marinobacter sp. 34-60-7]|nr:MAG: sortase, marine proteobacterial type [Marinobacter sp. 34-60-7]